MDSPSAPEADPQQPHAAPDPILTLPDELEYIVIEGVIGAGKTTLARLMAERFDAKLVLEKFEDNPFLERFYEDRSRWAFQTQLAFLASRFQQGVLVPAPGLVLRHRVVESMNHGAHGNWDGRKGEKVYLAPCTGSARRRQLSRAARTVAA